MNRLSLRNIRQLNLRKFVVDNGLGAMVAKHRSSSHGPDRISKKPHGFAFFEPTSLVVAPLFPACQPCASSSESLLPKDQRVGACFRNILPLGFGRKSPTSLEPDVLLLFVVEPLEEDVVIVK